MSGWECAQGLKTRRKADADPGTRILQVSTREREHGQRNESGIPRPIRSSERADACATASTPLRSAERHASVRTSMRFFGTARATPRPRSPGAKHAKQVRVVCSPCRIKTTSSRASELFGELKASPRSAVTAILSSTHSPKAPKSSCARTSAICPLAQASTWPLRRSETARWSGRVPRHRKARKQSGETELPCRGVSVRRELMLSEIGGAAPICVVARRPMQKRKYGRHFHGAQCADAGLVLSKADSRWLV